MKNIGIKLGTLGLLATTIFAPMSALADAHRQDNRNDVRNIVVSVLKPILHIDTDRDRNDRDRRDERGKDNHDARR